jgi:HPt (histidine-containing phosphotransfer) domain-containing protein
VDPDLRDLWREAKPRLLARCDVVRRAAAGDPAATDAAHDEAHKLSGSVGMYGLHDAAAVAAQLDRLVRDGALGDDRRDTVGALVEDLARAIDAVS